MTDYRRLAGRRGELVSCKHCGFCKSVCVLHKDSRGFEPESPRGRMSILSGLLEGQIPPSERTLQRLYDCTLCGHCDLKCPSGLKLKATFLEARADLAEAGLALKPHRTLTANLDRSGNIFGLPNGQRGEWIEMTGVKPKEGAEALFWVGCNTALREVDIPPGVMSLMDRAGTPPQLIEEPCCGTPYLLTGQETKFLEAARKAKAAVERSGARVLFTSCPGCYRAFKEVYPQFGLGLSLKVLHTTQLLADLLTKSPLKFEGGGEVVAYHDPCELGRLSGIYEEPRSLIKAAGATLRELPLSRGEGLCCGAGGGFWGLDSERSIKASLPIIEGAEAGDASTLLTACPACKTALKIAALRAGGRRVRVLDVAEYLASRLC